MSEEIKEATAEDLLSRLIDTMENTEADYIKFSCEIIKNNKHFRVNIKIKELA